MSESEVYDFAMWQLRPRLNSIRGLTMPTPYGGMERQVMVDLDPEPAAGPRRVGQGRGRRHQRLQSGLAHRRRPHRHAGISRSASTTARLTPAAFNDIPIKYVNGADGLMRDVAQVRDGFNVAEHGGPPRRQPRGPGHDPQKRRRLARWTSSARSRTCCPPIQAVAPKA